MKMRNFQMNENLGAVFSLNHWKENWSIHEEMSRKDRKSFWQLEIDRMKINWRLNEWETNLSSEMNTKTIVKGCSPDIFKVDEEIFFFCSIQSSNEWEKSLDGKLHIWCSKCNERELSCQRRSDWSNLSWRIGIPMR